MKQKKEKWLYEIILDKISENAFYDIDLSNVSIDILLRIGKFMKSSFYILVDDKMVKFTFWEYLDDISKKHIHTQDCGKCCFHQESLICHLVLSMLNAISYSTVGKYTSDEIFYIGVCGLLHDIGKYICGFRTDDHTLFPFHGAYGAGLLIRTWNSSFDIPQDIWEAICRTISVHMCGMHETDKKLYTTEVKWDLYKFENDIVKRFLVPLSFADKFSGFPEEKFAYDQYFFLESRVDLIKHINKEIIISNFKQKYGFRGVLISICGSSASGKSTISKKIIETLLENGSTEESIEYISRDNIRKEITKNHMIKASITNFESMNYKEIYDYSMENNLGFEINQLMMQKIGNFLKNDKIVIVDTVMTRYETYNSILNDSSKYAFKITIDCIRNKPIEMKDADRLSLTLPKQKKLFGNTDKWNWFGGKITKNQARFLSTAPTVYADGFENKFYDKSKPHLRFQVSWNNGFSSLKHILKYIPKLSKYDKTTLELEDSMNMIELAKFLGFKGLRSKLAGFAYYVREQTYSEESVYNVILIKYFDYCKLWRPKWARQGRGLVLAESKEDGSIICLKSLLQRGAEVITGLHLSEGIEKTETYNPNKLEIYDDEQKKVIQKLDYKSFGVDGNIEMYLTGKVDGSLCGVTLYPKSAKSYDIVINIINNEFEYAKKIYEDDKNEQNLKNYQSLEFAKTFIDKAIELDLPFIPLISSQGTFRLGDLMHGYTITAILTGLFKIPIQEIDHTDKPINAFNPYINDFMNVLFKFYDNMEDIYKNSTMSLSFETVCPKRTCAWSVVHTELAVSYDIGRFSFLGVSVLIGETIGIFLPHFDSKLSKAIQTASFSEPVYWKFSHADQICDIFGAISTVISSDITIDEFWDNYPPLNNINTRDEWIFDYEGFVSYTVLEDGTYDYAKMKTIEYYFSHKFHIKNIPKLLNLIPEAQERFPLAKAVNEFFTDLDKKMITIVNNLFLHIKNIEDELKVELNEKQLKSYMKNKSCNKHGVCYRILLANTDGWKDKVYDIYSAIFTSLNENKICSIQSSSKELIFYVEPWKKQWKDLLSKIIKDGLNELKTSQINKQSKIFNELFALVIC
ncbi:MAG: hypothetical protein CMF62_01305 [Magnetococcales bacterium]|nr:hypothetical protein [Magnetococcales bacterium]MBA42631.1 hypothetical protein [Magnetococcales bacterium]|tara:strand:- start:590 stop:3847 length:3258 start_codon:yes stop_codon:yes gene_type:complete